MKGMSWRNAAWRSIEMPWLLFQSVERRKKCAEEDIASLERILDEKHAEIDERKKKEGIREIWLESIR